MADSTSEETKHLLELLGKRELELAKEDSALERSISKLNKAGQVVWWLGAIISAVAIWAARLQWNAAECKQFMITTTAQIKILEEDKQSNQLLLQSMQSTIIANRNERLAQLQVINVDLNLLKTLEIKVNELWWMKERGISNKEEFQRRNGYPAPSTLPP